MSQASPCPDSRDLLRLTLALVPGPEVEPLGQHLLSCPHCAETLNYFSVQDTLIDALRGGRDAYPPDLPAVEALMDRLARTPPVFLFAAVASTTSPCAWGATSPGTRYRGSERGGRLTGHPTFIRGPQDES